MGMRYRWVVLAGCVLAYATSHLTRWSYTGLAAYISADLRLDKGALGLLGAAFFYPYALAQVPWGRLTDRIGGRYVISLGVVGVAALLGLFATARTLGEALGWRVGIGMLAGCGFVPIAALLARWFGPAERGVANGTYYGLGGGLGEGAAFLLLPVIGIYFLNRSDLATPDWRGAMLVMAVLISAIGILCGVLLRSAPQAGLEPSVSDPGPRPGGGEPRDMLGDPILWLLGLYFAAGIIALRLIPGWLTIYAGDLFRLQWGYGQEAAVTAGGMIGGLYVLGHVGGSPMVGRLSDRLLERGVNRVTVAGAVSLSLSGYVGMTLASRSDDPLAEYAGIWYLGAASCAVGALAGWMAQYRMRARTPR